MNYLYALFYEKIAATNMIYLRYFLSWLDWPNLCEKVQHRRKSKCPKSEIITSITIEFM
jgi:hypothetical protein